MPRSHPNNLAGDAACGFLAREAPARDAELPPCPDMQTDLTDFSSANSFDGCMKRALVEAVVLLWLTTAPALSFQFMLSLRRALGVLPLAQRESNVGRQHCGILCRVHMHSLWGPSVL